MTGMARGGTAHRPRRAISPPPARELAPAPPRHVAAAMLGVMGLTLLGGALAQLL
ncbi:MULTISPECIES: hypothetical protein [Deinococcus]|uniref:hypothetical protein n=1 Tax=Deinococcus TaxID=1298 RepID=UPI000AAC5AC8|nr:MULTISPECIES: hypothetical protein [Deinococcus]